MNATGVTKQIAYEYFYMSEDHSGLIGFPAH